MRLSQDAAGTPGIVCTHLAEAYRGLGLLHAQLRPLQTLCLATAARGQLMAALWPTAHTQHVDWAVCRLQLAARAQVAVRQLDASARALLDAYVAGVQEGFERHPLPAWQRWLLGRMRPPDAESVAAGLLLSGWLGQGEGQARMERALVTLVQHGADAALLQTLLGPLLAGLDVALLRDLQPLAQPSGRAKRGVVGGCLGGSNAWAVGPQRSRSGAALLAGDPHQPLGALPGMFLEVRVALAGADYLLGASVPGLPGFLLGRSRKLAWSGTFAFADNFDRSIEQVVGGRVRRQGGDVLLQRHDVGLARRLRPLLRSQFYTVGDALLEVPAAPPAAAPPGVLADGLYLAEHWAAPMQLHQTLAAFLQLPAAQSVAQASRLLAGTHALNLQFVLADAAGNICQQQAGALPVRRPGWHGLVPQPGWQGPLWSQVTTPAPAPVHAATAPCQTVVTANDGALPWASLPQPDYRAARIRALLAATAKHDVDSMANVQLDLVSLQAQALVPLLLLHLPAGPVAEALRSWDFGYAIGQTGPHAFAEARNACVQALAPWLGGAQWLAALAHTELGTWWCKPLDAFLCNPVSWQGPQGPALVEALANIAQRPVLAWGKVQTFATYHELWGRRAGRGVLPLAGSLATVCQGNVGPGPMGSQAVAPALRLVCDFATDGLYVGLPGGIHESPRAASYARWLADWQAGVLHLSLPPTLQEDLLQPG